MENPFSFIIEFFSAIFVFFPPWLLAVLVVVMTVLIVLALWRCLQ